MNRAVWAMLQAVSVAGGVVVAADEPKAVMFTKTDLGKLPAGWKAAQTGKGEGSVWKVVEDRTAPSKSGYALAQTARGPSPLFNLCVAEETSLKDVEVTAAFKANAGKIDQGGGVVWRYQDANNYYIARYNPLEKNFRAYAVVDGKRIQAGSKEVVIPAGQWFQLTIKHVGNKVECSLDGTKHLEFSDETFPAEGAVGLWTKADAHTHFDNFQARAAGR